MQIPATIPQPDPLPLKSSLMTATILSLVVAVGTAVASIIGLLYQNTLYPIAETRQSFVANDVVNLIIGLPILLGSLWLARRGRLIGLLFWPGALLYGLYNYTAYVFGRSLDWLTFIHLALVLLSATIVFELLKNMDQKAIQTQLAGAVPLKTAGWVLALFGIMFLFRAINMLTEASTTQVTLPLADIGVLIADMVLSGLLISGGVLLLRQMPLGYASGLGLLFAASMLFIGVIIVLLLQPVLMDAPFDLTGVITVATMGLVCFIPFVLFMRGVWLKEV